MCQKVTCKHCQKATFSGCGQHVEQVLRGVPASQRCSCSASSAPASTAGAPRSLWKTLTGRR